MPAVTVAMTALSASTTRSSAVASDSVLLDSPTAKSTVAGDEPDRAAPVSDTLTGTASAVSAGASRLTVKLAAVPSATGLAPAAIVASGKAARVTVTL